MQGGGSPPDPDPGAGVLGGGRQRADLRKTRACPRRSSRSTARRACPSTSRWGLRGLGGLICWCVYMCMWGETLGTLLLLMMGVVLFCPVGVCVYVRVYGYPFFPLASPSFTYQHTTIPFPTRRRTHMRPCENSSSPSSTLLLSWALMRPLGAAAFNGLETVCLRLRVHCLWDSDRCQSPHITLWNGETLLLAHPKPMW